MGSTECPCLPFVMGILLSLSVVLLELQFLEKILHVLTWLVSEKSFSDELKFLYQGKWQSQDMR